MCTLSWLRQGQKYSLFFNRDESVQRQKAHLPTLYSEQNVHFIMPVDPDGGGSWLTTNEFGLSVALLNFYQGRLPKGRLRSRGEVVRALAIAENTVEAKNILKQFPLQKYAPFSLFIFERSEHQEVAGLRWDGKILSEFIARSPFFSSAMDLSEVIESRRDIFTAAFKGAQGNPALFEDIHRSHLPFKSHLSICMHRDDAHTVSFSKVEIDKGRVGFYYSDGPPCENPLQLAAELNLRNL